MWGVFSVTEGRRGCLSQLGAGGGEEWRAGVRLEVKKGKQEEKLQCAWADRTHYQWQPGTRPQKLHCMHLLSTSGSEDERQTTYPLRDAFTVIYQWMTLILWQLKDCGVREQAVLSIAGVHCLNAVFQVDKSWFSAGQICLAIFPPNLAGHPNSLTHAM